MASKSTEIGNSSINGWNDQNECIIISENEKNNFFDYIVRNHEQQIHRRIRAAGTEQRGKASLRQTFEY